MGRMLVIGEAGRDFVPELRPAPGETVLASRARAPSTPPGWTRCCTPSGITHLLFAGVTTEVCVQTTMREANDRGYDCLLVEDCAASYFPHFNDAAVEMMRGAGRHRRLGGAARGRAGRVLRIRGGAGRTGGLKP